MPSPKKILAAAVAALSITACQETQPPSKPVIPAKTIIAQPPREIAKTVEIRDAGAPLAVTPVETAPVDSLALATETSNVDHLGRAKQLTSEGDVKGALLEARRALFITPSDVETPTTVAKLSRRVGQSEMSAEAWGTEMPKWPMRSERLSLPSHCRRKSMNSRRRSCPQGPVGLAT